MSLSTKLNIVFEDDFLLVINKPTGMVVNISETSQFNTVQELLQKKLKLDPEDKSEFGQRGGVVHRIDKDTSGLLVVAKNEKVFNGLKAQFISRDVKKEYLALVLGEVEEGNFEVSAPLKRNPKNRLKMAVVRGGKEAVTRFELIKVVDEGQMEASLLKCYPETGRTHQIRVHLACLNHPVVGDEIYMTKKQQSLVAETYKRLMLHAWKIKLVHPITKENLALEASLPTEFQALYSKPY